MSTARPVRWPFVPVFLFALLFPVLAIDVVARLLAHADILDRGNLTLLVSYESTRALICLLAIGFAALLLLRRYGERAARQLTWFLLFGSITYAVAIGGGGYVGPFQEWLTRALLARGLSRRALLLIFGYPPWPAWLALAGLVRFSLLFPEPLSEDSIARSGAEDRAGMMRSVPGAGVDVGRAARHFVVSLLRRGWLTDAKVWGVCGAGALLSVLLAGSSLTALVWLPYFAFFAVALTAFRASYVAGGPAARRRIRVLARSAAIGAALFVLSGIVGIGESAASEVAVFVLVTLAPLAVLIGLAAAYWSARPLPREEPSRRAASLQEGVKAACGSGRKSNRSTGT